jgi:HAE1 family hydrophobic/amphiphilic exporter-1
MIPLGSVLTVKEVFGPTVVTRHNIYPSAKITGAGVAGTSSGDAMNIIAGLADSELSTAMSYDWTDISFQEQQAAGGESVIFLLAIILVYLVLAAQYESWSVPFAVVLAVPAALLGAVGGLLTRGITNNVYTQIGIVLLIGLSAKTSILIVEFAKSQHDQGMSIYDAAMSAAKLRFRAVLMTALSFVLGTLPLLVATGAGARSRIAIGTAVFWGTLVATIVSVITVPMLYKIIQGASERRRGTKSDTGAAPSGPAETPEPQPAS